jgi:KDO2-lipid IV(A) lauroyltransferase
MVRNLGWMAAEFARLPKYSKENIEEIVVLDGNENFLAGRKKGKGVLILTGHIGAWELSSFAHALYGYPLHFMARPLDNQRIDALVNSYRCGSGKIFKNESARVMLKILKDAGTIGTCGPEHHAGRSHSWIFFASLPPASPAWLCIPMRQWCWPCSLG